MKQYGILISNDPKQVKRVYGGGRLAKVQSLFAVEDNVITEKNMTRYKAECQRAQVAFSTWGMPALDEGTIKACFPNLKAVFYAAGSVQGFARPFLKQSVRIFSAWQANAVPVSEYVFAQIILAAKGCFQSARRTSWARGAASRKAAAMPGIFEINIGLIGAGKIGSLVAERLKTLQANVFVYDPYLPREKAEALNVTLTDLHTLFESCDIISNHLADNEQTRGMLDKNCFQRMKKNAVFLNTGRGAQVVEKDLLAAMRQEPGRFALLDVTWPEPPGVFSGLNFTKNIILTPHIAGSSGNEVWRMADYMIEEAMRWQEGKPLQYEITEDMLRTMA